MKVYLQLNFKMKVTQKRDVSKLYRPPPPEDYSQNYCRLIVVIAVATVFIAVEILGGTISGSIAIISDAIHLVSDLIGFIFSFVFLYYSKREMNKKVSFGYHRMELIGALINIFIVWAMVLFIMYEATLRIVNKQFVKKPVIMLITSLVGLLINIVLYKILHGGSSHSHGLLNDHSCDQHEHSHDQQPQKNSPNTFCVEDHEHTHTCYLKSQKKNSRKHICDANHNHTESHNHQGHNHNHNHQGHHHDHKQHKHDHQNHAHQHHDHQHGDKQTIHQSIGMKSAIIHALSDLVQGVGVVISAIIIYFLGSDHGAQVTEWNTYHLFDPISTYIFSILSLLATLPVIYNCYYLVMESTPNHIDLDDLKEECQRIQGVVDVHDIHVWDLKPGKTIMIAHVLAKKGAERRVLTGLTDLCRKKKIYHSTFQVQEQDIQRQDYILCHHDIH